MNPNFEIIPNTTLQIHICNNRPIELFDLTKSLSALSSQFSSFSISNGESQELKGAKLYVKQVKDGSLIIELIEYASMGLIPIIVENPDLIIGFAKYLKGIYDYFLSGEGEKPLLTVQDCKEFMSIVETTANDTSSKMEFNIINNSTGTIQNTFNITNNNANAIQNKFKKEIDTLKRPTEEDNTHEKQLMTMYQARSDMKSKVGNKAVVDALYERPLNVVFGNEDIKEKMLNSNYNPLKTGYSVDVVVQTIRNVPCAYKIIKLHEISTKLKLVYIIICCIIL
ncbi:hypothetical protein EZS27_030852 [termite gut metagenome]|uniref:Uncharacterized protein n=1 Tax=termite gut metagenome TaxID=433724 RepID=A0A5J4QCH8_9ZZZZ